MYQACSPEYLRVYSVVVVSVEGREVEVSLRSVEPRRSEKGVVRTGGQKGARNDKHFESAEAYLRPHCAIGSERELNENALHSDVASVRSPLVSSPLYSEPRRDGPDRRYSR